MYKCIKGDIPIYEDSPIYKYFPTYKDFQMYNDCHWEIPKYVTYQYIRLPNIYGLPNI